MSDEEKKNSNVGSLAFPIFICNVIVLANTTREGFNLYCGGIGEVYWLTNQILTWGSLTLTVMGILTACGVIGSVASDGEVGWCAMICGSVTLLAVVAYLLTVMVLVGMMWYKDPEHTFLGYGAGWTGLVCSGGSWAYQMAEVLNGRITPFGVFFIDIAVGVMLLGGLCALICCRKKEQTPTANSQFGTFTTGTGRNAYSTHASAGKPVVVSAGGRTPVVANGQLGLMTAGPGNV